MIALYLPILVIIPLLGPLLIDQETLVFLKGASLPLRSFVSGLLVAVYVFLMLYMAPALGRLSDQWGRRPVLLLCGVGVLLGNLSAGFVIELHILPLLSLGRLIGGATAAAQSTAQAALGGNKLRLLSYSMLFSSLGFVLGPVVASGLSTISFAAPLHFCTLLALVALVLLWIGYRDEAKPGRRVDWSGISTWEGVRCFRDAARDGAVRGILGCCLPMQVAWGSFFVLISVYLMEARSLDKSLGQVGAFMSIMGIGFCVSNALRQSRICGGVHRRRHDQHRLSRDRDHAVGPSGGGPAGLDPGHGGLGWGISSVISGALGGLEHALPVMLAAALMAGAAFAMMVACARWQSAGAPGKRSA